MSGDRDASGAFSTVRFAWKVLGISVVLGALLLSGLSIGAPSLASAGTPSRTSLVASASTTLTAAMSSLSSGAGPAAGGIVGCQMAGAVSATCSGVAPASPRPAVNANGTWVNITGSFNASTAVPDDPYISMMTYDDADGYVLLFGGYSTSGASTQGTWTYQNGLWTELFPSIQPGPRVGGSMTYDPIDKVVVLFGGYDTTSGTIDNDTWTFLAGNWTELFIASPQGRWRDPGFAWDSFDGYAVLTGGTTIAGTSAFADTWTFVNDTWTNITSQISGGEPSLYRCAETYDAYDQEIVLFGGSGAGGSTVSQTWVYHDLVWTKESSIANPQARVYPMLAYDPSRDAVILFGGSPASGSGTPDSDTWSFQAGNWTQLMPTQSPQGRAYTHMVFDPVSGFLLLWGGYTNSIYYFDTWTFGAPMAIWGSVAPAGVDAGARSTISLIVAGQTIGNTYWYTGLPGGCTSANTTLLNCTPTRSGVFSILAGATDAQGDNASTNLSIDVRADPAVTAIQFSPQNIDLGVATNITAMTSGGSLPLSYNWTKLPPGCTNGRTVTIACTPSAAGTFPVAVTVTDQAGVKGSLASSLTVNSTPTILEFASQPTAIDLGQSATLYANVSSGTAPYSYFWSNLPAGCSSADTPVLHCAPLSANPEYRVEVQVTDVYGKSIAGNISLAVNLDPVLKTSGLSPSSVDEGQPVTIYVNVSDGTTPFVYQYTGLPAGCAPIGSHAATCRPSANGTFPIEVTVTDGAGQSVHTPSIILIVLPDPTIASFTTNLPATDVGRSIQFAVNATNGDGQYLYAYSGLPSGCSSSDSPTLSCRPIVQGHFTVTANVQDLEGVFANASLNLTIGATPTIGQFTINPSTVAPGGTVTLSVSFTGGVDPRSFHYSGLPAGCHSENASKFACAPSALGSYTVTVTMTDVALAIATGNATLDVSSGSSSSIFGLPPVEAGAAIGIPILVIVAALAVVLSRRRKAAAAALEPAAEE